MEVRDGDGSSSSKRRKTSPQNSTNTTSGSSSSSEKNASAPDSRSGEDEIIQKPQVVDEPGSITATVAAVTDLTVVQKSKATDSLLRERSLTKPVLIDFCTAQGLRTGGNKDVLIERLKNPSDPNNKAKEVQDVPVVVKKKLLKVGFPATGMLNKTQTKSIHIVGDGQKKVKASSSTNPCFLEGLMKRQIDIRVEGNGAEVAAQAKVCEGECPHCREQSTCTVAQVSQQRISPEAAKNVANSNVPSSSSAPAAVNLTRPALNCTACGKDLFVKGVCYGNPEIVEESKINHCLKCQGKKSFGICNNRANMKHCDGCNEHFFVGTNNDKGCLKCTRKSFTIQG
jgi:hypothetical protein